MAPFFHIITRTGLLQRRVAAEMGVSQYTFTRTKRGTQPLTAEFQRRATAALRSLGVRKEDGSAYAEGDLFLPTRVTDVTENASQVTEDAA